MFFTSDILNSSGCVNVCVRCNVYASACTVFMVKIYRKWYNSISPKTKWKELFTLDSMFRNCNSLAMVSCNSSNNAYIHSVDDTLGSNWIYLFTYSHCCVHNFTCTHKIQWCRPSIGIWTLKRASTYDFQKCLKMLVLHTYSHLNHNHNNFTAYKLKWIRKQNWTVINIL